MSLPGYIVTFSSSHLGKRQRLSFLTLKNNHEYLSLEIIRNLQIIHALFALVWNHYVISKLMRKQAF